MNLRLMKRTLSLLLPFCLLLPLFGCNLPEKQADAIASEKPTQQPQESELGQADLLCVDLMANVKPGARSSSGEMTAAEKSAIAELAMKLLVNCRADGSNILISPLSILSALAMTCNGARGETLREMESVLGMPIDELNNCVSRYLEQLPASTDASLLPANSIWFDSGSRFKPNQDFLVLNATYYGADAYSLPFNDKACQEINDWVSDKTNAMIPQLIDRIPPEAVMYLINALAFEAEWEKPYKTSQIHEDSFTREDGTVETAEFLSGEESVFLEDDFASGFIKYYSGRQYAFIAMLPNEGVSLDAYLKTLDGLHFLKLMDSAREVSVRTMIPKFESSSSSELSDVLRGMGIKLAFDQDQADLSGLGEAEGNLYISRVLHKTYLSLTEQGTRAGAASAVEIGLKGIHPSEKEVLLNRPFVYCLVDCETSLPFFVGTLEQIHS